MDGTPTGGRWSAKQPNHPLQLMPVARSLPMTAARRAARAAERGSFAGLVYEEQNMRTAILCGLLVAAFVTSASFSAAQDSRLRDLEQRVSKLEKSRDR